MGIGKISAVLILTVFLWGAANLSAYAAPSIDCELRLGAWCITDGAHEIDRRLAQDSVHDRVWTLRGKLRPESKLIILEPNGCGGSKSDIQSLVEFQHGYKWDGRSWDQARLRLKSNGTCDLTVLFPAYSGDPLEWAILQGLRLIRPCGDEECSGGDLTAISDQILARHKENRK